MAHQGSTMIRSGVVVPASTFVISQPTTSIPRAYISQGVLRSAAHTSAGRNNPSSDVNRDRDSVV